MYFSAIIGYLLIDPMAARVKDLNHYQKLETRKNTAHIAHRLTLAVE